MTAAIEQAYRLSIETPLAQIVQALQETLTRRMVAYIAGVKDGRSVTRWSNGDVVDIRQSSDERLRAAYWIMQLLSQYDSPAIVKAWFIGLNPQLGDVAPAEAIRDGRLKETLGAARVFIVGG